MLLDFTECWQVLLVFYRVLPSISGFDQVVTRFYRVLPSLTGFEISGEGKEDRERKKRKKNAKGVNGRAAARLVTEPATGKPTHTHTPTHPHTRTATHTLRHRRKDEEEQPSVVHYGKMSPRSLIRRSATPSTKTRRPEESKNGGPTA